MAPPSRPQHSRTAVRTRHGGLERGRMAAGTRLAGYSGFLPQGARPFPCRCRRHPRRNRCSLALRRSRPAERPGPCLRESIGFVEDGGDTGMETVAHLGGGIQNSQPIAFPPPFVTFPGLRAGFGLQFGDAVVAMAEPFKELDEGVKPSSTCARTRKGFGPIREPAKRRMALVLRWEQRKNQVSGRFHSSHQNEK